MTTGFSGPDFGGERTPNEGKDPSDRNRPSKRKKKMRESFFGREKPSFMKSDSVVSAFKEIFRKRRGSRIGKKGLGNSDTLG